jgi:putative sterol carrier protein
LKKKAKVDSNGNHQKQEVVEMALTDVKEVFNKMPETFSPSAAQGLDAVFQFDVTGEGGGNWNITIKHGACQVQEGTHEAPTVTLTMSAETWLGIVNKELNGMQAFMSGQLQATGDVMLASRIEQLFPL